MKKYTIIHYSRIFFILISHFCVLSAGAFDGGKSIWKVRPQYQQAVPDIDMLIPQIILKPSNYVTQKEFEEFMHTQATAQQPHDMNAMLLRVAETPQMLPEQKYSALATLLEKKADAATRTDKGSVLYTLIHCALFQKRDDDTSIQLIIKRLQPLPSVVGAECLERAVSFHNLPLIQTLLDAHADVNYKYGLCNQSALETLTYVAYLSDEQACAVFKVCSTAPIKPDMHRIDGNITHHPPDEKTVLGKASIARKKNLCKLLLTAGAYPAELTLDMKKSIDYDKNLQTVLQEFIIVAPLIEIIMQYVCYKGVNI